MKKQHLIPAALVLIALLGVFFMLSGREQERTSPTTTTRPPFEIAPIEDLARVVLNPSTEPHTNDGGVRFEDHSPPPKEIVLERRGGGRWWITSPIEGPVHDTVQKSLEGAFAQKITADNLFPSEAEAESLWLSKTQATRAAFYTRGSDTPALTLRLGKSLVVPGTRAERTFVKRMEDETIYRARVSLRGLTARDPKAFRSNWAILKTNTIPNTFTYQVHGEAPMTFSKRDDTWVIEEEADMRIEQNVAQHIAGLMGGLQTIGSVDDVTLSEYGLQPPGAIITAGEVTLHVGAARGKTYVKRPGWSPVYEVSPTRGPQLLVDRERFRSLVARPIDVAKMKRVRFPGGDAVVLERRGEVWGMASPTRMDEIEPTQRDGALHMVGNLRATRYIEPDLQAQELTEALGEERLVVEMEDGARHELLLGGKRPIHDGAKDYERYARFLDDPETVFLLSKYAVRNLRVSADMFELRTP